MSVELVETPDHDAGLLARMLVAHRRHLLDPDALTEDDRYVMLLCCGRSKREACCIDYLMPDTRREVRRNR